MIMIMIMIMKIFYEHNENDEENEVFFIIFFQEAPQAAILYFSPIDAFLW